ncbi:MAG: transcriptional repressor LexA [Clostridia bacterium]|nr:transcriptional repressor LexA [Clostridia bacterium]
MEKQKIDQTAKVLKFIEDFMQENSYPPTVRDMCKGLNISSTATIVYHLRKLEKQGKLSREKQKNRAIEINGSSKAELRTKIPVVGKVAAGEPILATENVEDTLAFSDNIFGNTQDEMFILKVSGDSMVNIGIYDGDKIVVMKQATAENGEIVVAMVDDSATVKRFFKEDGHIRLQPENDYMEPIIVENAVILGKVVGLIRQYK